MRYIFCLLLCACPIYGQNVKVTLHNGSVLVGKINVSTWVLENKHGTLKIPNEDMKFLQLGLHYDEGMKAQIESNIKRLGSEIYKERELAQAELVKYSKYAVPFLKDKKYDVEQASRMKVSIDKILEACPVEYKSYDTITTLDAEYRGNLSISDCEVSHPDYGTLKLKLSAMSKVQFNSDHGFTIEVKADSGWIDTGYHVEWGNRLIVRAEGSIDLWPQGPGQYMAGPDGLLNVVGRGNIGRAGQLMIKVGEAGQPVGIGEINRNDLRRAGNVYLMISQNSWSTMSSGSYKVTLKGE